VRARKSLFGGAARPLHCGEVVRTRPCKHRLVAVLRRLLRTSVPFSLAALACAGDDGPIEETVRVASDRAPYAELVSACRADDAACDPLCEKILAAQGEDPSYLILEECRFRDLDASIAEVEITYSYPPESCGRRPAGWTPATRPREGELASHLARCAELEHASVHEFLRLALVLEELVARHALAAAARAAAAD
jgi:hypothetical protein